MMNIKQLKDMALEMKGRYGEQWQSALCESGDYGVNAKKYHAVISEQNDDLFIKTDDDSLENSWLCDYLEAVSPGNVLEIIKRLAAAEAKLSELDKKKDILKCSTYTRPAPTINLADLVPGEIDRNMIAHVYLDETTLDKTDAYVKGFKACIAAIIRNIEEANGQTIPAEPAINLADLMLSEDDRETVRADHAEWSQTTFGNVGPVGPLRHLAKEAEEAADIPGDLSEWADMQFLLWDAQRRAGITDEQITRAMIEKLAVNKARDWPEPKDGEPRMHIKAENDNTVQQYEALAKSK